MYHAIYLIYSIVDSCGREIPFGHPHKPKTTHISDTNNTDEKATH